MALRTTTIRASFGGSESATTGATTLVGNANFDWNFEFSDGSTGANKAQHICTAAPAAGVDGTGTTYDLTAMTGSVVNSATVNFSAIASISVYNSHATNTLYVGGAASNAFVGHLANTSDIIVIPPGGSFTWCSPTPKTTTSQNNLKVYGSGAGTTFQMVILGV